MSVTILTGDSRQVLKTLLNDSVQMCITSPPYFGLRDYGMDAQIGLETTPDAFVQELVDLFREVRRILREDGTLWLNLGDSYNNFRVSTNGQTVHKNDLRGKFSGRRPVDDKLKEKDLIGIPWRVAFALQADGWYLRQDIIWHKPNPMPESVRDRCTKAHEYVFLLAKSERYFYDAEAIAEEAKPESADRYNYAFGGAKNTHLLATDQVHTRPIGEREYTGTRNARSVWSITTQPFKGAHFATMPPELAKRCILAGSRPGDMVLDPFGGAGTTGIVADREGRHATLIEINSEYAKLAERRIANDNPMFTDVQRISAEAV